MSLKVIILYTIKHLCVTILKLFRGNGMLNEKTSYKIKVLSLISMVMVLFIHSYNLGLLEQNSSVIGIVAMVNFFVQDFISQGLTRVAIPIFFLISGFFLFKNFSYSTYPKILKTRYYSLFIPYLFWSILVIGVFYILQNLPMTSVFFDSRLIENLSITALFKIALINPKNYPLWFLRDLILLILISPAIYYFLYHHHRTYLSILTVLWLFFYEYNVTAFTLYKPDILLFFSLGGYMVLFREKILTWKVSTNVLLVLSLVYIVLLTAKTYISWTYDTNFFIEIFLRKISIFIGIIVIWFSLDRVSFKPFHSLIPFTFLLFVFHEPLLTIFKKGLLYVLGDSHISAMIIYFMTPALTIFVLVLLGRFLQKHLPKTTSVVTGNRM